MLKQNSIFFFGHLMIDFCFLELFIRQQEQLLCVILLSLIVHIPKSEKKNLKFLSVLSPTY